MKWNPVFTKFEKKQEKKKYYWHLTVNIFSLYSFVNKQKVGGVALQGKKKKKSKNNQFKSSIKWINFFRFSDYY
jgi:hypothetical protein